MLMMLQIMQTIKDTSITQ